MSFKGLLKSPKIALDKTLHHPLQQTSLLAPATSTRIKKHVVKVVLVIEACVTMEERFSANEGVPIHASWSLHYSSGTPFWAIMGSKWYQPSTLGRLKGFQVKIHDHYSELLIQNSWESLNRCATTNQGNSMLWFCDYTLLYCLWRETHWPGWIWQELLICNMKYPYNLF